MEGPIEVRMGSISRNQDQSDLRRGWVVGLDILWPKDDHELFQAVEVYGESPDEVKVRAKWLLDAIDAATLDEIYAAMDGEGV